jgi:hypothetical protein
MIRSDLEALSERSKRDLPTTERTAQGLWNHNLRRSEEGSLMKVLHPLKSHPAMTTVLGIAVVAAVLLAVPISYTKTTGYEATLEISDAAGIDIDGIAREFGKALDTEDIKVMAAAGGGRITASLPVRPAGTLRGIALSFAKALTMRGISANARVEPVTEQVTGNVYAMAANGIVEIRINSEGLTDEEIEAEIRAQIEAAGFEACLVDVETGDGEKRIEIGIQCDPEDPCADGSMPVRISIDGMEPPPAGEYASEQVIELRVHSAGKTLEEARAEAVEHLEAMGFSDVTDIDIEDCGDYYRIRVPAEVGAGTALGKPGTESKTWGEVKKKFTE